MKASIFLTLQDRNDLVHLTMKHGVSILARIGKPIHARFIDNVLILSNDMCEIRIDLTINDLRDIRDEYEKHIFR